MASSAPQMVGSRGPAAAPKATPGEFLLPTARIALGDRLRPVRQSAVDDLIVSLTENPLAHPITVRPKGDAYELVLGAHRLAAFQQMGRPAIPVVIRDLTDLEARQLEIDENLVGADLTALERMTFLAERLEVWAARNPDRVTLDASLPVKRRGRPPRHCFKLKQIEGYAPLTMGFARETARETGLSAISVYKAAAACSGLPEAERSRLHGTWIAKNDAVLRQLATIGGGEELTQVIDQLLAGKTKNVAEARALAAGRTPAPKAPSDTVQRDFERAWKAATPSQRDGLLHWLSGQPLPKGWTVLKGGEG